MNRMTVAAAMKELRKEDGALFKQIFRHGSLEVEIYQPKLVDMQKPHARDEIYVVVSGSGYFVNGTVRQPFEAGEVLFVAAGVEHRFEEFTPDFATWVIFYGPEGGERSCEKG